jgi:4-amino-4-deoxy-L-arabinose transferase-like glycosyltransferase
MNTLHGSGRLREYSRAVADDGFLYAVALIALAAHLVANGQYGFHRDELQFIADSRHLAGGFVAYPPLTAFFAALARTLFGESLAAYRLFPALAHTGIVVIAGLIARELGGKRFASALAGLAALCSPTMLFSGSTLMYVAFDYLFWAMTALFVVRVLRGDARYWIGVGVSVGLGMMSKYSVAFLVIAMALAIAALPERRLFKSRYFAIGVCAALAIVLPNLVWLIRHDFVTYDFLKFIHARDITWGRTRGFLANQFIVCLGAPAVPLAFLGAWFLLVDREARRFRAVVLWTVLVLAAFALMKGRDYYTGALYVPLVAAGAAFAERELLARRRLMAAAVAVAGYFCLGAALTLAITLPFAPAGSPWFTAIASHNGNFVEEFGWEELAEDVAVVREALPESDRARFGILAGNYGEAGALEYYGRRYGFPKVMCGTNSFYDRGYDEREPDVIVAVGFDRAFLERFFGSCEVVAHARNALNLANEETTWHRDIYLCRKPNFAWPEFWKHHRSFG